MECKVCHTEFKETHFNQKCCSPKCKKEARAITVRKYKDTNKGIDCLARWYISPARVKTESIYRGKPESKALAVKRTVKYTKGHPEQKKASDREYGYRKRGYNAGFFDRDAIKEKFNSMGNVCVYCGSNAKIEVDHIVALSRGGTNDVDNLQPLCKSCNSAKGAKSCKLNVNADANSNTKRKM